MGISNKTKNKYNSFLGGYQENEAIANSRNQLAAMQNGVPEYNNSYASQLKAMYDKIKNGADFNYSPDNDAAYRRFADEYNALSGLAIAGNQQQAQGLTGEYGSTYAADVSAQGLQRMRDNAANAQPLFMQQAEKAYMANTDADIDAYKAAAQARDNELNNYAKQVEAFNNRNSLAQKEYADSRDYEYKKYSDNRDFWSEQYQNEQEQANYNKEYQFKVYDTYNKLAANKCADYKEAQNNSGMKAYLNGLVKEGKLTQYMADNLYKQYKYEAPKRSGGGGGGRRSSKVSSESGDYSNGNEKWDMLDNFQPNQNIIKYINMNNRAGSFDTAVEWINSLRNSGKIGSDEEALLYKYYYLDLYSK